GLPPDPAGARHRAAADHHADRPGRGGRPRGGPGGRRRRLRRQALQPPRAGGADQGGPAPGESAARTGGARGGHADRGPRDRRGAAPGGGRRGPGGADREGVRAPGGARPRGRALTREQLLETVWGYANAAEIESRTVDVHVRRLREKLGPAARLIETVKGLGYRLALEA